MQSILLDFLGIYRLYVYLFLRLLLFPQFMFSFLVFIQAMLWSLYMHLGIGVSSDVY